jgi:hypothetical protein
MRTFGLVVAVGMLAAGCARRVIVPSPVPPGTILSSTSDGIRVMEPRDGAFGSATDPASGRRLADRVVEALQGNYVDVQRISTTREPDALQAARAAHARYLVEPTILLWEDRTNTTWSMSPDRLRVLLALREVASDRVVNALAFEAKSRNFFIGGDPAPDVMLDRSFDRAVLALLQR